MTTGVTVTLQAFDEFLGRGYKVREVMIKRVSLISIIFLFSLSFGFPAQTANSLDVVINEIAWMGTEVSYNDEWVELYNNTDFSINLEGWVLKAADGTPEINLTRTVLAKSFYLLERTDDNTVSGITADQIYTGALGNNGENLGLYDNLGNLIDSVNCTSGWFAGDNLTKQTMERTDSNNWQSSQNPGGTPKAINSVIAQTEAFQENESVEAKPHEILPSPTGPDATEEPTEDSPPLTEMTGTQKELAAASSQISKSSKSLYVFLIALGLAIFSGVIILILKRKLKLG